LAIPRDVEAPGVAVLAGVLLEGGTVGFEADNAGAVGTEFFRTVAGGHIAARVAVCGVDPTIVAPAEIINDGVGVVDAEAGVELGAFVGDAVVIGVFEIPDVGRGGGDDAVAV